MCPFVIFNFIWISLASSLNAGRDTSKGKFEKWVDDRNDFKFEDSRASGKAGYKRLQIALRYGL